MIKFGSIQCQNIRYTNSETVRQLLQKLKHWFDSSTYLQKGEPISHFVFLSDNFEWISAYQKRLDLNPDQLTKSGSKIHDSLWNLYESKMSKYDRISIEIRRGNECPIIEVSLILMDRSMPENSCWIGDSINILSAKSFDHDFIFAVYQSLYHSLLH